MSWCAFHVLVQWLLGYKEMCDNCGHDSLLSIPISWCCSCWCSNSSSQIPQPQTAAAWISGLGFPTGYGVVLWPDLEPRLTGRMSNCFRAGKFRPRRRRRWNASPPVYLSMSRRGVVGTPRIYRPFKNTSPAATSTGLWFPSLRSDSFIAHALAQIKLSNGDFSFRHRGWYKHTIRTKYLHVVACFHLVFVVPPRRLSAWPPCPCAPSSAISFVFRPVSVRLVSVLCVWHFYEWPAAIRRVKQIPLSSQQHKHEAIKYIYL